MYTIRVIYLQLKISEANTNMYKNVKDYIKSHKEVVF